MDASSAPRKSEPVKKPIDCLPPNGISKSATPFNIISFVGPHEFLKWSSIKRLRSRRNLPPFYYDVTAAILVFQTNSFVNQNFNLIYYMACVCSRYNARSDWLIVTEL